jgi:hypothetical protein
MSADRYALRLIGHREILRAYGRDAGVSPLWSSR